MSTYRKILGLSLAAILAVAAVSASAASAAEFEGGSEPTFLLGEQQEKNVLTVSGFPIECVNAVFEGQGPENATDLTVHPNYTNCTFFGGSAQVITASGSQSCNYTLFAATDAAGMAQADIICDPGLQIKVVTSACTLFIGEQKISSAVAYDNVGNKEVLVTLTTGETVDIAKKEGPLCGLLGNVAQYSGSIRIAGFADPAHTNPIGIKYVP